jgi:hypothetical protein
VQPVLAFCYIKSSACVDYRHVFALMLFAKHMGGASEMRAGQLAAKNFKLRHYR